MKTPAGVEAAQQAWLDKKRADEQQCQFAQHWTKFVEGTGAQLAAKLPNTVAPGRGTTAAALAELNAELDRRQKGETADRSLRFLLVLTKLDDLFELESGAS